MCLVTVEISNSCKNNGHLIRAISPWDWRIDFRFEFQHAPLILQFLHSSVSRTLPGIIEHYRMFWLTRHSALLLPSSLNSELL